MAQELKEQDQKADLNEAPKKIWVWDYAADQMVNENPDSTDVAYIRADLVDGLVEALGEMTELNRVYWKAIDFNPSEGGAFQEVLDKARAALKALEEE